MMLSAMAKKTTIKKVLKWIFGGFSIFFIGILFFIVVYDALTGASSQTTAEYCAKYGFLASPYCR
ncbi:MAG TPA: hypothetical protein VFM28_01960 [Nitrososphaeraceae archaeon]|nr:hypothetical protein [Nitrososphaeraceae archaeon]